MCIHFKKKNILLKSLSTWISCAFHVVYDKAWAGLLWVAHLILINGGSSLLLGQDLMARVRAGGDSSNKKSSSNSPRASEHKTAQDILCVSCCFLILGAYLKTIVDLKDTLEGRVGENTPASVFGISLVRML